MFSHRNDPLLLAGRVLTIIMQGLLGFAAVALAIATPVILLMRGRINLEIAEKYGDAASAFPTLTVVGLMLLGFIIVTGAFIFFGKLRKIIETVGDGDPFAPENAERLNLMAWLTLGVQVLLIPAAALGVLVAKWADQFEGADIHIDAGVDLSAILLVIVLFILARVFRHGAAMREDLEGTV
ncbi:DUF2975 domain-containing protein [Altererythrobacter arenosus]|uniref:DUF2975 domain-containing protein n=1 Tax=Altererythrobacter arenosus TaxID=3032592 RepID=A0ABY8FVA7_9SPHN|nr:DUF2975 domain-containing protein [Altererythrobacter sp. CAU 1644]WFL78923.1 DUF2975 domain-containing protein [Altererythrobacter sp. CAU 1644]